MPDIRLFKGKYAFLSNFYVTPIFLWGVHWPSSEHLYMAMKTEDKEIREKIRMAPTSAKAKRLGRDLHLRPGWEEMKVEAMLGILRLKFIAGSIIAQWLLDTGESQLIEGNYWHDQFWGDCECPRHKGTPGKNMLGTLLMQVREELQ